MYTQEVVVNGCSGLHSHNAVGFIQCARRFKSRIWLKKENMVLDARSLLGLLAMNIESGNFVTLIADGCDEQDAVATLTKLLSTLGD